MKPYLKDLKESFYTCEWVVSTGGCYADLGSISLWIGNGAMFFTGYDNTLYIPFVYRAYMWHHFRCGQSALLIQKAMTAKKAGN